jgi:hypothetical protein
MPLLSASLFAREALLDRHIHWSADLPPTRLVFRRLRHALILQRVLVWGLQVFGIGCSCLREMLLQFPAEPLARRPRYR